MLSSSVFGASTLQVAQQSSNFSILNTLDVVVTLGSLLIGKDNGVDPEEQVYSTIGLVLKMIDYFDLRNLYHKFEDNYHFDIRFAVIIKLLLKFQQYNFNKSCDHYCYTNNPPIKLYQYIIWMN